MARVLVTGGLGFIGSHTVDQLIKSGHEVVVMDNLEFQVHNDKWPEYANQDAEYVIGDVRFKKHWRLALKGVEYVIHLAGIVGAGQSFWETRKYVNVNIDGTATLFQLLVTEPEFRYKVNKFITASSKNVYGEGVYRCLEHGVFYPPLRSLEQLKSKDWEIKCPKCHRASIPLPIPETKPLQNPSPYALTSYAVEQLTSNYSYALDIPSVSFRYFSVYGPRESFANPHRGALATFVFRLFNDRPPVVYEDGKMLRDQIYVGDVARANVAALSHGKGTYNLGTGRPISVTKLAEKIKSYMGSDIGPTISEETRLGDNRHDYADMKKFKDDFRISTFTSIEKGIKKFVDWGYIHDSIRNFDKFESQRKYYIPL